MRRSRSLALTLAVIPIAGALVAGSSSPVAAAETCVGRTATIVGTYEDDTLIGTPGNDVIVAGAGNDRIEGGRGNDIVCAGSGSDFVLAGAGRDRVYGEEGFDEIVGGPDVDQLNGGPGTDAASYWTNPSSQPVSVDLNAGTGVTAGVTDTLIAFEDAYGGAGNDRLSGTSGVNYFAGGLGNDTVIGGRNNDIVVFAVRNVNADLGSASGEGLDRFSAVEGLFAVNGPSTLTGGPDTDFLISGTGRGRLIGGGGRDILDGGGGNDRLEGGKENDFLYPGTGNDTLVGGQGTFDQSNYALAPSGVRVDLTAGTVSGGSGNDDVESLEWVIGSAHADRLSGSSTDEFYESRGGKDTIFGGRGTDVIVGDGGSDTADGGSGYDGCDAEREFNCETGVEDRVADRTTFDVQRAASVAVGDDEISGALAVERGVPSTAGE